MNLCVFCLAELFPSRWQDTGSARRGADYSPASGLNVLNVSSLLDDGWTMYSVDGRQLSMRAVSQFNGTLVCASHAIDAVIKIGGRW